MTARFPALAGPPFSIHTHIYYKPYDLSYILHNVNSLHIKVTVNFIYFMLFKFYSKFTGRRYVLVLIYNKHRMQNIVYILIAILIFNAYAYL